MIANQETKQNSQSTSTSENCGKPNHLNQDHWHNLIITRDLDPDWMSANSGSVTMEEASELLNMNAKSGGIWLQGWNGQLQVRPDKPWRSDPNKKAPKYRTPAQEAYDLMLPTNPHDENYWDDLEKLKEQCIWIGDTPCILLTEGFFKAIMGCAHGYPTVALCGVEMGLSGKKHDKEEQRYLVETLRWLVENGFGFIIVFDADAAEKKEVIRAEKTLAKQLQKAGAPIVYSITGTWTENLGKGMDDFIQNQGIEAFREKLKQAEPVFGKYENGSDSGNDKKKRNVPSCGEIASYLFDRYRNRLAWDTSIQQWRRYGATQNGVWDKEVSEFVRQLIYTEIATFDQVEEIDITPRLIRATEELLQYKLAVRQWDVEDRNLLPVQNGVLDLRTHKLMDHSPGFRLTWCLPTHYDPKATCEPIKDWLLETCGGDEQLRELLRAYLYGILTGRTDWQKFLELIGAGATGKSTYIRLAIALVGANNVHTTTLKKLEGSRFESACIKDKRLVVITDSERYTGNVSMLKALTGQDTIPYEVKMKQSTGGFVPRAMVLVAANEQIQSGDYTSGLERRRVSIPFNQKIPESQQRNLIELGEENQLHGEFVKYIPGLLNWVLEVNPEQATAMIKNYTNAVPSLGRMKAESLCETNPIADWLDNAIVYRPGYRTQVGVAKRDKNPETATQYYSTDEWLYANYCEYCANTQSKPIGLRRFVSLVSDVCVNQLGLNIKRERDSKGRYFNGLKIRSDQDDDPALITGYSMTDADDTVTDSLTDKSPSNAKFDGYDGSNQIQSENDNLLFGDSERNNSSNSGINNKETNQFHPSHSSDPAQSGNSSVTDSSSDSNPSVIDYSTFPATRSDDYRHKQKEAQKIRQQFLAIQSKEDMDQLKASYKGQGEQANWVWHNLLTQAERDRIKYAKTIEQSSLFDSQR